MSEAHKPAVTHADTICALRLWGCHDLADDLARIVMQRGGPMNTAAPVTPRSRADLLRCMRCRKAVTWDSEGKRWVHRADGDIHCQQRPMADIDIMRGRRG